MSCEDNKNENQSKASFIGIKLPEILISTFQWLLLIEKLFEIGTFSNISWGLVFLPTIVKIVFALVWPTDEIKEIIDKSSK